MSNNVKKKSTIKKIIPYIKRYMFFVVMSLIFAAATVGLTLYIPKLTGEAIDLIIDKGFVDFEGIFDILLKIGVFSLVAWRGRWGWCLHSWQHIAHRHRSSCR